MVRMGILLSDTDRRLIIFSCFSPKLPSDTRNTPKPLTGATPPKPLTGATPMMPEECNYTRNAPKPRIYKMSYYVICSESSARAP